jgi:hypothetical protein
MPLKELPRSPHATMLEGQIAIRPGAFPPDGLSASLNVAVVKLPGVQACGPDQTGDGVTDDAFTAIHRAIRGFTLAEQSAPVVGISWIDFCDPELTLASVGLIWNGARFEGSLNRVPTRAVDEEVLDWVERYLHLSPEMCDVVDVAMDRLNLARRRTSLGDKAIDGAICLESLLGDGTSQELSYRLKLRAALLLGKAVEERKAIRDAVRKFYTLRSNVVHGRAMAEKNNSADGATVAKGLEICGLALQAIVKMNRKPIPSEWELSGGVSEPSASDL